MALVLTDMSSDLRLYLRDSSGLNTLLCDSTESSDMQLDQALRFALHQYNFVAPLTTYSFGTAPEAIYFFIINRAVINVLISSGILNARNRLNYSDGGLTIADHDKAGPYQSWIQMLTSMFLSQEKQYKMSANLESCYSVGGAGMASEFLSFGYDSFRIFDH